jgi:energy-coupling factor transporter ATP-binding protein EcfA2
MNSKSKSLSVMLSLIVAGFLQATITSEQNPTANKQPELDIFRNVPLLQAHKKESPGKGRLAQGSQDINDAEDLLELVPSELDIKKKITKPIKTRIKSVGYIQQVSNRNDGDGMSDESLRANSGYIALQYGLESLEVPHEKKPRSHTPEELAQKLFAQESSEWRSFIIKQRRENTLKSFLEDHMLLHLAGTHTIPYSDITSLDFYLLQTTQSVVVINSDVAEPQRTEIQYLAKLIPLAAQALARAHAGGTFTCTPNAMYAALEKEARSTTHKQGIIFSRELFERLLGQLPAVTVTLKVSVNHNEVLVHNQTAYAQTYGPLQTAVLDGSWLSNFEIKDLAESTLKSPKTYFKVPPHREVRCLEFSKNGPLEERISNSLVFNWLRTALQEKQFTTLLLISFDKEWTACTLTKTAQEITLSLIDPHNKDRHATDGIGSLVEVIEESLYTKKNPSMKKNEDIFKDLVPEKEDGSSDKKNSVNYEAPLAFLPDSEIPSLSELFGEKIPNVISVCIKHMEKGTVQRPSSTKLKNCLLLYGPPGTGKSTIAQVMARTAGRNIVYAGGGDFRDAYQGSGKAKLDALFAEAKRRGNCVILIDEIDGTSARLQPTGSTQEDNRALKSLITTLDQYRYDPDIFVICTTNYIEEMDPAVTRRCKAIHIPLPDYAKRKKIINYYLKRNNIEVASRTPHALSPDFYDKLISATDGFSGDDLGEMINNAVFEFDEELVPEARINLEFRTMGVDLSNKSILANLGELALIPLIPAFMMLGESDLDQHVYSAFKRQARLRADIKEKERQKENTEKYGKEPFFTRIFKRNLDTGQTTLERVSWELLIRGAWTKISTALGI